MKKTQKIDYKNFENLRERLCEYIKHKISILKLQPPKLDCSDNDRELVFNKLKEECENIAVNMPEGSPLKNQFEDEDKDDLPMQKKNDARFKAITDHYKLNGFVEVKDFNQLKQFLDDLKIWLSVYRLFKPP